jgi:hypothetical protein
MKKNGMLMPSHIPALTYQKPSTESNSKISSPIYSQNGHMTDPQSKSKPMTNGYHLTPRRHQLNSNNDKNSKTSRRTSKERRHSDLSSRNSSRLR